MVLGRLRRSSALALVGTVLVLGAVEDEDRGGCHPDDGGGGGGGGETTNTVQTQYLHPVQPPGFDSLRTTEQQ